MKTILIFDQAESSGGSICRAVELAKELPEFKFIILTYTPLNKLFDGEIPPSITPKRVFSFFNSLRENILVSKLQEKIRNPVLIKLIMIFVSVIRSINKTSVIAQSLVLTLFRPINLVQANCGIHFLPYNLAKIKNIPLIYYFRDLQPCKHHRVSMINRARHYVFVGENLMEEYLMQLDLPKEKCSVVHSPINANHRISLEKTIDLSLVDRLRQEGKKIIISSGRICRDKGQDITLDAFIKIIKKYPLTTLIFAGAAEADELSKKYLKSLKDKTRENQLDEKVFFLGYRKDVLNLTKHADIAVQAPIYFEGLGGAIVESLQLGVLTICSATGGTTEVVIDNETGFLFPVGDANALAEVLDKLLSGTINVHPITEAGKTRAIQKWDIVNIKRSIQEIYISSAS